MCQSENSEGISYVLFNGKLVVENGKHTGKRSGTVLYGKGRSKNETKTVVFFVIV